MEMTELSGEITQIQYGLESPQHVQLVQRDLEAVGPLVSGASGAPERKQATDLVAALATVVGPDAIMAWVRSHVGSADPRVRETAALALAALASSHGVARVHGFVLSFDCVMSPSWRTRWTGSRATELMAATSRTEDDVRLLVEILYRVLDVEFRLEIRRIAASAACRLAEAAGPSHYQTLHRLLFRLLAGMAKHRNEVQAAFMTAVTAMIGLMDGVRASLYSRDVLRRCFDLLQSPDGAMETTMLEAFHRCAGFYSWDADDDLTTFVVSRFLRSFWVRRPARDRIGCYCKELADATAVLANRVGLPAIRKILAETELKGQSEDCVLSVMETMEKVLAMMGSHDDYDARGLEDVFMELPLNHELPIKGQVWVIPP